MRVSCGRATVLCGVLLGLSSAADAQAKKKVPVPLATAPKVSACGTPAHRQFDFWLGDWDVSTPQGAPAGTNRVEKLLEGCALQEHWEATDGSKGTSLSSYDSVGRRWRQTFV